MELDHSDPPTLQNNRILVEQKTSSINPVDVKVRNGDLKFATVRKFPKVPGVDFAGIVKASKNSDYKEGDEVFGYLNPLKSGAYAEQLVVTSKNISPKPKTLTFQESGVVPTVGLTAMEALINHGQLNKDDTVFINGCSGGVGSFAVKIAKAIGADVTGTCSGKNIDFAGDIGVDHLIDYTQTSLDLLPLKFDVVLDTTGKLSAKQIKKLGKNSAKLASVTTGFTPGIFIHSLFTKGLKMINTLPNAKKLNQLKSFIDDYHIKPVITREWSMEDIQSAFEQFEKQGGKGKVSIIIQE